MLDVAVSKRLGGFHLDVALTAPAGSTLVVVGESGSGKTTLLRLLAGLARPDSGRIMLGGRSWFDASSGTDVPAWQRAVGFVPQDYALFPHLTVAENVAFGLQAQGMSAADAASRVAQSLDRLGVASFAASRPSELSGGQQQRVALARALVLEPELLLLDEPLSALDLRTRQVIRTELRRILETLPCVTVYVTHAPSEALVLGDQIAVLENGRVTQLGGRDEFLRRPRSSYVAAFLGINLFRGRIVERLLAGLVRVATEQGELLCVAPSGDDAEVVLTIAPSLIALHRVCPEGRSMNIVRGTVTESMPGGPAGERVRVTLDGEPPLVAEIGRSDWERLALREGEVVWASFEAADLSCYS
jgi:molybdate transport system ATP-binding protein